METAISRGGLNVRFIPFREQTPKRTAPTLSLRRRWIAAASRAVRWPPARGWWQRFHRCARARFGDPGQVRFVAGLRLWF